MSNHKEFMEGNNLGQVTNPPRILVFVYKFGFDLWDSYMG